MFCVRIRARPGTEGSAAAEECGAYAHCYIDFPDSRGAEILARWYVADGGWIPECVLEMREFREEDEDEETEEYIREARETGCCIVIHGWEVDADDATEDDAGDWNPPGARERRLAEIAGTYTDAESDEKNELVLRTDRHFSWGNAGDYLSGTWHVDGEELTLAYFPTEGSTKGILDGPWGIKPGFLVGTGVTLGRVTDRVPPPSV